MILGAKIFSLNQNGGTDYPATDELLVTILSHNFSIILSDKLRHQN